jgi:hypothetical protein
MAYEIEQLMTEEVLVVHRMVILVDAIDASIVVEVGQVHTEQARRMSCPEDRPTFVVAVVAAVDTVAYTMVHFHLASVVVVVVVEVDWSHRRYSKASVIA